jgi:hypothetical protein
VAGTTPAASSRGGARRRATRGQTRGRGRRLRGPGEPAAHQEGVGAVGEARGGLQRRHRPWPELGPASSIGSSGSSPAPARGRDERGQRDGAPGHLGEARGWPELRGRVMAGARVRVAGAREGQREEEGESGGARVSAAAQGGLVGHRGRRR